MGKHLVTDGHICPSFIAFPRQFEISFQYIAVFKIIQFLKVMYLILTLQVHLTLPSVFSKTDSVFLKEEVY